MKSYCTCPDPEVVFDHVFPDSSHCRVCGKQTYATFYRYSLSMFSQEARMRLAESVEFKLTALGRKMRLTAGGVSAEFLDNLSDEDKESMLLEKLAMDLMDYQERGAEQLID